MRKLLLVLLVLLAFALAPPMAVFALDATHIGLADIGLAVLLATLGAFGYYLITDNWHAAKHLRKDGWSNRWFGALDFVFVNTLAMVNNTATWTKRVLMACDDDIGLKARLTTTVFNDGIDMTKKTAWTTSATGNHNSGMMLAA